MQKIKILIIISIVALTASGCILRRESKEGAVSKNGNTVVATFGEASNQTQGSMQNNSEDQQSTTDPSAPSDDSSDSAQGDEQKETQIITLKTSMGDIKIELFLKDMPITAGNFLKLAKLNFYDSVTFHRVIPDFMIQGGDPLSKDDNPDNDGQGGPGYFIEDEFSPEYSNVRSMVSMANAGPGTGGSQFFINTKDNSYLDFNKEPLAYKHPVFGKVIEGMDVVDAISAVETSGPPQNRPLENVVIEDVLVE